MIIKPLFYEYTTDSSLFEDKIMNSQLLIGRDLMVTPILENYKELLISYFPSDEW